MSKQLNSTRRQAGVSSTGWLAIVAIFGLLVITFFKVFPMYYENFKLRAAMEALAEDTNVDPKSKREIWFALQKRMFVDEVKSVKREHVTMERKDGKTTITVRYEAEDDYIANLFIGARFVETAVIER